MLRILMIVLIVVGLTAVAGDVSAAGHDIDSPASPAAQSSLASAVQGESAEEAPTQGLGGTWIFLILMLAFMYFVLIRPQGKEQKRRKSMMSDIKVGDKVVTIGGMHGSIERRGEEDVDVKVADGIVITFNLGAISQVVQDGEQIKGRE